MKTKRLISWIAILWAAIIATAPFTTSADVLVPKGSSWKFNNSSNDLGTIWQLPLYDDSSWGGPLPGPLGDNLEGSPGVQLCRSVIGIGPVGARIPTIYFRSSFNVTSAGAYSALILHLNRDDGAVVYLNGHMILADRVQTPTFFSELADSPAIAGADETNYFDFTLTTAWLSNGVNVLAVEVHNQAPTSSDLQFDLGVDGIIDQIPPTLAAIDPAPGTTVLDLTFVHVTFSENVTGVNASDLLINNVPASSVATNDPTDYSFSFPSPGTGSVLVAWAANHGITDLSPNANPFAGGSWVYKVDPSVSANVVISEFEANNKNGIKDDDGNHSDWIELANFGTLGANLNGWYLTDEVTNLTKWRIPAAFLDANKYMIIWASAQDRTNLNAPLHTNFKLQSEPGFLALVDPNTNIVSSFNPYPQQSQDVSYGRDRVDPNLIGYYSTPTPGAQNATSGTGFGPAPVFSVGTGIYTNDTLTLTISAPSGTIRYTVGGTIPNATNSIVYSGPIVFGTNVTIKARVFPADTNMFPGPVVVQTYLFLDSTTVGFNSNLPLLIMSTEGKGIAQSVPPGGVRTPGSIIVIETVNGKSSLTATPQFQGVCGFELYGQTSIGFPKPPVRIEIQDALGNDLKVPLLDMPAESDWRTRNPYDDRSLMNDYMGYTLHQEMGHYGTRIRFVETFLDTGGGRLSYPGDYIGVETLVETIKTGKDRVDIADLTPYSTNEPSITGGWMIKYDKDSAGDLNISTPGGGGFSGLGQNGDNRLKIHEPKSAQFTKAAYQGITTRYPGPAYTTAGSNQLKYITGFLAQFESCLYASDWLTRTGTNHWSFYYDADAAVDFHWIVEFTRQIDGIRLSDYMTKDRGGKLRMEPVWDWNLSFGNADYLNGGYTNGWYYDDLSPVDHMWLRRLISGTALSTDTTGDPDFTQKITDRWGVLRTNILNGPRVVSWIDELALVLTNAATRDFTKWGTLGQTPGPTALWPCPAGTLNHDGTPVPARPGTPGTGPWVWDVDYTTTPRWSGTAPSILGYLKKWVLGRYLWIDGQFTSAPVLSARDGMVTNGSVVTITGPAGAAIYYTTDGTDPRGAAGVTNGTIYTGPIAVNANVRIVARAKSATGWKNTWSPPVAATLYSSTPSLRITEIMYHPDVPTGSTNSAGDFEYIEVKNIGATPLNVNRFTLSGGITFQFPNVVLLAGQSAVIVANIAAFQSRYGDSALILGTFTGNLANGGDHLVLQGSVQEPILDFSYKDGWYPATDGFGFSLVVANENAPVANWGLAANWRPSSALGGSPGQSDPAPPSIPPVLVNEALANTTPPLADAIELYNPTASPADISGWFLSDSFNHPKKYVIPAPAVIPAFGFIVFYETNSFNFPTNGPNSFALSSHGESVWLFSGNGTNLTGRAHGFDFGASASGVTFGRYVISTGDEDFVAQTSNSLGATNAGPLVGPIVISEINNQPPAVAINAIAYNNTLDEYIELQNITATSVPLHDPSGTNTWHLRNAVDFDFPTNVSVPAHGFLLVVSFDPNADPVATASFRARNSISGALPLYGPWSGVLDNQEDDVELHRPDLTDTNANVQYLVADKVHYTGKAPWPTGAGGFGLTLQRVVPPSYGNDPSNWVAQVPSPGGNVTPSGTPPVITSQPTSHLIPTGTDALLSVAATGTSPLHYQWQRNGLNVAGATNFMLPLNNFQVTDAGTYNVLVYNSAGSTIGTEFVLFYRTGLQILAQPSNRLATNGATTNFTVMAVGSGNVIYQWTQNGGPITATNVSGINSDTLTVTNVQSFNEGTYVVTVSDDYGVTNSQPVTLTLITSPVFTVNPISQTALEGGSVTFSAAVSGTAPITFRWRKGTATVTSTNVPNGFILTNATLGYSTLTLTNLSALDAPTNYNVVVSNLLGFASQVLGGPKTGVSSNAVLTLLADADRDGIPDILEPLDGAADNDHDGMSNAAEYLAGTDYNNSNSVLRVQIARIAGGVNLTFTAVSNRTYTVQYSSTLNPLSWQKLSDVLAGNVTRTATVSDPNTNRFYRLITPIQR